MTEGKEAVKLIGALLRKPPKPHAEMKLGKPKRAKSPAKKRAGGASAKAKTYEP
jgi:hypothetical protein